MLNIKIYGLICFSIIIFLCTNNNISAAENNDVLKFETVIKNAKQSIVLLSTSPYKDPDTNLKQSGLCSGVVVNEVGHILTNFHCIYKQKFIKVIYYDKNDWQTYDVEVIGTDPLADLALLKVLGKVEKIPYLKFAKDIKNIAAGLEVFALGHPMGMIWTVTKGIISSNTRFMRHPYIKALQTDAAINKGNSGGPLMNMKGEIVGINALLVSRTNQNAGIGLAIRGDVVQESYKKMSIHGKVDRPAVGVQVMPVGNKKHSDRILKKFPNIKPEWVPNTYGLFIASEKQDNPKNIKQFDTIVGIGGVLVNTGLQFSDELIKYDVGETIFVMVIRKKVYLTVKTTLKVFPVETDKLFINKMTIRPPKIEEKKSPEPKK